MKKPITLTILAAGCGNIGVEGKIVGGCVLQNETDLKWYKVGSGK